MLKLGRNERLKESVLLPGGKLLTVNTDMETNLRAIITAQTAMIKALGEWQKTPNDEHFQRAFYTAYEALLVLILGDGNYKVALEAYSGDVGELCAQFDSWVARVVYPAIERASHAIMERRKRQAGKLERKVKRRIWRGGKA